MNKRFEEIAPALAVAALTALAFAPVLFNGFVNWDDPANFLDNPHWRGLGWEQLRWMFGPSWRLMGNYSPLAWLAAGGTYATAGLDPSAYHAVSLALHSATTVLFFLVARRLLNNTVSAFFAALLFSLHPQRVEAVAWFSCQIYVLAGAFLMGSLLAYLNGRLLLSLGLYACSLLSYPTGLAFPLGLIILDRFPLRRGWVLKEKLPYFLLAGAMAVVAVWARKGYGNFLGIEHAGILERISLSLAQIGFYISKTLFPTELIPVYANPATSYVGLTLGATALIIALRKRIPSLPAAAAWFVILMLPTLALFQGGTQNAADRYTYLPILGFCLLAGSALGRSTASKAVGSVLILVLGILTWRQSLVWRDSETLWTTTLKSAPRSPIGRNNLGNVLWARGQKQAAEENYRAALSWAPNFTDAHNNLARALAARGEPGQALAEYQKSLDLRPDQPLVLYSLGQLEEARGRRAEAAAFYRQALALDPALGDAAGNLGLLLFHGGKPQEALDALTRGAAAAPHHARVRYDLGVVRLSLGQNAEAAGAFREALVRDPDSAEARNNLGAALSALGRHQEAEGHWRETLRRFPGHSQARNNLAVALARQGRVNEAMVELEAILRDHPDDADARKNLRALRRR